MSSYTKKIDFFETDAGHELLKVLKAMDQDLRFNTEPTFSSDAEKYPDNLMPFVDKHVKYIRNHPATNPQHYLANLRLITKVRT